MARADTTTLPHALYARGRVLEAVEAPPKVRPDYETGVVFNDTQHHLRYNTGGKIDGARIAHYDPYSNTVVLRADHSTCPSFWLEIHLPMAELKAFIEEQGV